MASLATLHFVDYNFISSDQTFIRRLCTRCKAPLLQECSLVLRKIKFLFTSLAELHQLMYNWTIFSNYFLMNEWPTWPTFRGKVLRKCRMFFLVVNYFKLKSLICLFLLKIYKKKTTNKPGLSFFSFFFSFFLQVQRDNRCSQCDHK